MPKDYQKYGAQTDRISLRIPKPLHTELKKRAKKQKRPKSEVLVNALADALETPLSPPEGVFE